MLACFKKWLARHTQTAPPLCCFALNEPSGLDSGASPSLATLAAAQGRCSLSIIVALESAAGSLKAGAVAGMACSVLAINQRTLLSAADFTRQLSGIFLVIKKPQTIADLGFCCRRLTMTYSHMGRPHTTIGDASFHF